LPTDDNPLIEQDFQPISGWTIALFLAWLVPGVLLAVLLLPRNDILLVLGGLYAAAVVAVVLAVLPRRRQALAALAFRPATWRPFLFGSLATLALSIGASQIGPEVQGMKEVKELVDQPGALLPSLILLAGLAPLAEELVFRGLLYGWLEGRWGWKVAYAVSSIAFAVAHFEPAHILLVLPLAVVFGWLRWRTNSLLPSLAAHVVNNGFAVASLVWLGS
jgi:uncharacterized protein